jgi:hypothetical protein
MDKRYYGKHIPKFSKIQMEEAAKAFYDIHMTDTITYKDVWATRTFAQYDLYRRGNARALDVWKICMPR